MNRVFDIEKSLDKIKAIGEKLLPYAIKMDGRGRTGCYLTVITPFGGVLAVICIGRVDNPKDAENWRYNSPAKSVRLFNHAEHFSGWQSRIFEAKDYGGSIQDIHGNIYGCSGFNEHVDEALSAAIACGLSDYLMPLELQERIVAISENPHLIELCEKGADWDLLP